MKTINIIKLCGIFLLILAFAGCKKFVEVSPPVTQLVSTSVFDNNYGATSAQTTIYTAMATNQTYLIEGYTGLSSDELESHASSFPRFDLFKNELSDINDASNGSSLNSLWADPYKYIFQANSVIEGLQQNKGVSAAVKKQLNGEAKFIRAFWYFDLVNLYGDVPLLTSTDYKISSTASRTPKEQVYKQVVADLLDAQSLLNSNFVDASDTLITTERVRPTKWAATALLARVYLYMGTAYDKEAEAQATAVINNSALFSLTADLNQVFLENSSEAIWQLMIVPPNYYADGGYFILLNDPASTPSQVELSNQLINTFEPGDTRKINWINSLTVAGSMYSYPYKYKASTLSTSVTEYEMVLRLAEQYLIRAEARAQQGNISGAQADLNMIRHRAGLPNTTANDKPSLLKATLHERQVELFTEWGHRWFDLKRTNSVDSVMARVTPLKGGNSWKSYQQLYPIPINDIQNDPNLKQTEGY